MGLDALKELPGDYIDLDTRFERLKDAIAYLLKERDSNGMGLPYTFIHLCIHANFPKAQTTVNGVRDIGYKLERRGVELPKRPPSKTKGFKNEQYFHDPILN